MKLVIGSKHSSSWSLRPWLLMKVKNIEFEEILIPLDRPDTKELLLEYSPAGKVPVLIDREILIWDSLAIAEYLVEKFPDLRLWPADAVARAAARSVTAEMHSGFGHLRSQMPMDLRDSHPDQSRTPAVLADIARITTLWQDCRTRFGNGGDFLFGSFGVADAFFAPVVTRFVTYAVPLPKACAAYADAIRALPAMQDWYAASLTGAD